MLWCAVESLMQLKRSPLRKPIKFVIFTGDKEHAEDIIEKAKKCFGVSLPVHPEFIRLENRRFIEASHYPRFTLLGQSLGSIVLVIEALWKRPVDLLIDTTGLAFTFLPARALLGCSIAAYIHYPTISLDMLNAVSDRTSAFNNDSSIAKSSILTNLKLFYYRIFALSYHVMGRMADVVMVNSSWTYNHILSLWKVPQQTTIVYPPCDTESLKFIPLDATREPVIISVAQFRPEKNHLFQIECFHKYLKDEAYRSVRDLADLKLIFVGSCRNEEDYSRVENLRLECERLEIADHVEFRVNIGYDQLKLLLKTSLIGFHAMKNEHFGIAIVEYMAAGVIPIAHNSGGPAMDIVTPINDIKTGFLASSVEEYAEAIARIMRMSFGDFSQDVAQLHIMRRMARESVNRFNQNEFKNQFCMLLQPLLNGL